MKVAPLASLLTFYTHLELLSHVDALFFYAMLMRGMGPTMSSHFLKKINVPSFKFSNKREKPSYFFHRSAICSEAVGH